MQKVLWVFGLAAALATCGCDNKTQANTQKIDVLTQKMFILQQAQIKQLEAIQKQVASLPPLMDKLEKKYFTESQDKALFYHTNALYFMVAIDKRIQAQFDQADAARKASDQLAYFYHTNETGNAYLCASQIVDAVSAQGKRIESDVYDKLQQNTTALSNEVITQLKTLATDTAKAQSETAKQAAMEAKLNQIQNELDQIKAMLQKINLQRPSTNSAATNP